MSQVIIGMDPHKRSATIEVMTSDETVVGGGRLWHRCGRDEDADPGAVVPRVGQGEQASPGGPVWGRRGMGAGRVGVLRAAVGPLAAPRPPLPGTVALCWACP